MSLIQVCIENEIEFHERDDTWPLRELLRRLLKDYDCDINIMDFNKRFNLLTFAAVS